MSPNDPQPERSALEGPPVPDELIGFLSSHDTFYLLGHVEPDGDCIASALALGTYLHEVMGKRVRYYNEGPFIRREIAEYADRFSSRIDESHRSSDPHPAAIILDCTGPDRVGALREDLDGLPLAVVDHHATGTPYGDVRFVDPMRPATCYLVQLIIERLGGPVGREAAELLLFGIATDTGFFRHVEADAADLFAGIARLLAAGASPKSVHAQMFGGHTFRSRGLLATLLSRAEPVGDGAGVLIYETLDDAKRYGRESRDSDTLYQLLFGIDGLRTAALVREESEDTVSGSLRSIDSLDVSRIASDFGGGGHKRASGFTTKMSLKTAIDRVRVALESALADDE